MELMILALIAVPVVLAITLLVRVARTNTGAHDSMSEKWLQAYRASHPF